jgi:hypothetical protein
LSTTKTAANLLDLTLAAALTPSGSDVVHRTTANGARGMGVTGSMAGV